MQINKVITRVQDHARLRGRHCLSAKPQKGAERGILFPWPSLFPNGERLDDRSLSGISGHQSPSPQKFQPREAEKRCLEPGNRRDELASWIVCEPRWRQQEDQLLETGRLLGWVT